jgi:hypothetical protein
MPLPSLSCRCGWTESELITASSSFSLIGRRTSTFSASSHLAHLKHLLAVSLLPFLANKCWVLTWLALGNTQEQQRIAVDFASFPALLVRPHETRTSAHARSIADVRTLAHVQVRTLNRVIEDPEGHLCVLAGDAPDG